MKKRKVGIIASSVAAIAVCSSMVVGSTFALFTSEDTVNITVTSGNVEVKAEVAENSLKTWSLGKEMQNGEFANGGFASVDGGELTLDRVTPGDKAEFDIVVTNNSSVTVQFRTVLKPAAGFDNSLLEALTVTVDETEFAGTEVFTTWQKSETKGEVAKVHVAVELPEEVTTHQAESCKLTYFVEAVQGNANVKDFFTVTNGEEVTGYASLAEAFENVEDNGIIDLNTDCTLTQGVKTSSKNVTLNGNKHTVTLNCGMTQATENYGFRFGDNDPAGDVVINDLTVTGKAFVGIQMHGANDGGMCNLSNVKVYGQYSYTAVNFNSSNGGTLKDCEIINSIPDSEALFYNNKDYNLGAISVFANRHVNNPLTLDNSIVKTLYVNKNDKEENHKATKVFINNGSKVENIITSGKNIGEVDFYAVENEESTVKNALFCGSEKLYTALNDENTYVITSADYLARFAELVNAGNSFAGKTVLLANDIDLAGINWTPIGTKENPFKGTFDGQEHTISNLTINTPEANNVGLFGYVTSEITPRINAGIKNLNINNFNITGAESVGGLVGLIYNRYSFIEKVNATNINVNANHYGGAIAGHADGEINNCVVDQSHVTLTLNHKNANGEFDDGDKAGLIAGFLGGFNKAEGNVAKNSTVTAYRDLGGLFGNIQGTANDGNVGKPAYKNNTFYLTNNTVENVTLSYTLLEDGQLYEDGDTNKNCKATSGRYSAYTVVASGNTATNVKFVDAEGNETILEAENGTFNEGKNP